MAELFEIIMIVSFGFSWPMNVIKSYRARTTKGKSLAFLLLISIGYVFGIAGKLIGGLAALFLALWQTRKNA